MAEHYTLKLIQNLTEELRRPLDGTHRIKYTCYDVSKNFIVCGALSGSLYLFQRHPCKFLQLIPNMNGAINMISISPQEHYVAFTTQKGTVLVYVIDFKQIQPVFCSSYYHEMKVTQIRWKKNESQFYLGDFKGTVFLVNLNIFLGRSLSNITIHPILFLESPIVQICDFEHLLLVSNYTKCILCNTETEEFKQIGNQPRDGSFGACFLKKSNDYSSKDKSLSMTRVICARPNARIWECSIDGHVLQTHKFKSIVETEEPTIIHSNNQFEKTESKSTLVKHEISEKLTNLQTINKEFVIGHTSNAFYIFDLLNSKMVLWSNTITPIHTIKVIHDNILIFTEDQRSYSFQLILKDDLHIQTQIDDNINVESCKDVYDQSNDEFSESNILKNLFFVYKSFKMSKFNVSDHYFEFFTKYDVLGIKRLLDSLGDMIMENDSEITELEARQICASIYLNYVNKTIANLSKMDEIKPGKNIIATENIEATDTINEYIIECFSLINSPSIDSNIPRCVSCNFPLSIDETNLEYKNIAKVIIEEFLQLNEIEQLFDLIDLIPTLLNILLTLLTNENYEQKLKSDKHKIDIVDIYFACSSIKDKNFIPSSIQTIQFWATFFSKLIQLHNKNVIQCIRCKTFSTFNFETNFKYSYDFAFNKCIEHLNGISALELCELSANNIPFDAISKNFFIKCMLKPLLKIENGKI